MQAERVAPIRGGEVENLALTEYRRFCALVGELTGDEWSAPTDCTRWTVREVALHVLGATEAHADYMQMARQLRHGRRGLGFEVDRINEMQIAQRDGLGPADVAVRLSACMQRAARRRSRFARRLGALPVPVGSPFHETWSVSYLFGVIYTRDTWMHRIDLCRATGRTPVLSTAHDGRIVADIVAEWARRHRQSVVLQLTGPIGGRFVHEPVDVAGEPHRLTIDAVEFTRVLSGRAAASGLPTTGLLAAGVPF